MGFQESAGKLRGELVIVRLVQQLLNVVRGLCLLEKTAECVIAQLTLDLF